MDSCDPRSKNSPDERFQTRTAGLMFGYETARRFPFGLKGGSASFGSFPDVTLNDFMTVPVPNRNVVSIGCCY